MDNVLDSELYILEGTYGDREVHLCRCMPKHPNGINVILLHGVHSSANLSYHNKFRHLAEILAENGLTPWLVETSRKIRDRQEFKDNITAWIKGSFRGKTFTQEQEDVFVALRKVIEEAKDKSLWLWGFSLGGIIALSAAAGGIVREGVSPIFDRLILSGTGLISYPQVEENMMKLPILSTLRSVISPEMLVRTAAGKVIAFRGERDEIFSKESCLDLLKKINIPESDKFFHTIEKADHSLRTRGGAADTSIMNEMLDFLLNIR